MSNTLTHYSTEPIKNPILLAEHFAKSGYFKDTADISKAVVKIIAGQELGFGPMASISGFHIIQGKPTLSANLMAAAIKRSGKYNFKVKELTEKVCSIEFFENNESCGTSTFTIEEAQRAGTQNLQKFPKNMLYARALSNGAKWFCPDILNGSPIYTPDELGAEVDEEGEVVTQNTKPFKPLTEAQNKRIHALFSELTKLKTGKESITSDELEAMKKAVKEKIGIESISQLSEDLANDLIQKLENSLEAMKPKESSSMTVEEVFGDAPVPTM